MPLQVRVVAAVSRVLARLHRWYAAAWVLSRVPLAALDETSIGRLRYALMMAHRTAPMRTERLLDGLIRRSGPMSAELQMEFAAMANAVALPEHEALLLGWAQQRATDPATRDAVEKLLRLNRAEAHRTLQPTLQRKLDALPLQDVGLLTLVPVSGRYLDLWDLWLVQVRTHACRQIVAMAIDDAAYTALQDQPGVAVVDVREFFSWDSAGRLHPHTRGVLWYLRVLLLRDLVARGHPVLILDLDAIPVGDVQAMLSTVPDADVVAQKDHSIPMDVDRQLGFVLCCGFMLWRPGRTAGFRLLDRFAQEAAVERDDQLALNHLLQRQGVAQREADSAWMRFESGGVQFACPDESLVSRTLASGSVVRHFHQTGKSVAELRDALRLQT